MASELLADLVRANLAGSAAILAALLLRGPATRAFGAGVAYARWLVVPAVVLASFLPLPTGGTWLSETFVVAADPPRQLVGGAALPVEAMLVALWATGALGCLALLAIRQSRFIAELGDLRPGLVAGRPVLRAARAQSAAVVGLRIVVPADFEERFAAAEQATILEHEVTHLRRGDVAVNALVGLIQCLCWFNPLVHYAAMRLRMDQELACDAAVVARRPELRRAYAEALLKSQLIPFAPPVGCTWPSRAPHPLKERILMLKSPSPTVSRRLAGAAVLVALSAGGGYVAWAAQPAQPAPAAGASLVTSPDWIERPTGEMLAAYYPAEAKRNSLDGQARMLCRVEVTGALSGCIVESETPAGAGFGDASLRLASSFRMKPASRDGQPTAGGQVRIPIMFRVPKPAPEQPARAAPTP